jgi:hypothetical protein
MATAHDVLALILSRHYSVDSELFLFPMLFISGSGPIDLMKRL